MIISVFQGKDKFVYISDCNSDEGEFGGAGLGLNFASVAFSQCSLNWVSKEISCSFVECWGGGVGGAEGLG